MVGRSAERVNGLGGRPPERGGHVLEAMFDNEDRPCCVGFVFARGRQRSDSALWRLRWS